MAGRLVKRNGDRESGLSRRFLYTLWNDWVFIGIDSLGICVIQPILFRIRLILFLSPQSLFFFLLYLG